MTDNRFKWKFRPAKVFFRGRTNVAEEDSLFLRPACASRPHEKKSIENTLPALLRLGWGCLFSAVVFLVAAQSPDGDALLRKADENRISGNKIILSEMIIHGSRADRSVTARSWIQGVERSFTEYLEPPREKGVKMLKIKDQLWIFYPSTDRIILISGNMLRQSVMGSDLSYEDAMEDPMLSNSYEARVEGEEAVLDRPCWVLTLAARKPDLAYHSRKVWIDKERSVVMREERFARSGRLLKTAEVQSVVRLDGRWVADKSTFKDALKDGKGTEFVIKSIEFDADIPDHVFSKASLKK